jgi:hypothetical protein
MNVWVWNPAPDGWGLNPATVEALATALAALFAFAAFYVARRSLRAAKTQTAAMESEINSRMRPWVGLFGFAFNDDSGDQTLNVVLRNFGSLPADNANLVVTVSPHTLNPGEQPNPARNNKTEKKALMPLEDGNYTIRLSPYPQIATWVAAKRDLAVEGTFTYTLGERKFESTFAAELWFSRSRRPDGSLQSNWRNVSAV